MIRQIGYPRFIGLKSKRYAEVHRPNPLRSFWPLRSGHPCRFRAFICRLANVRQIQNLCAHDLCALQMNRRKTPSPALAAARAQGLARIAEEREAKRAKLTAEASSAAAPVDSGTDPPPAGRFRRSCRTPTAQVQSGRPLQLPPLLRTAR